jgi:TonB family protein
MSWIDCIRIAALLALGCGGSDKPATGEPGESDRSAALSRSTDDGDEEPSDGLEVEGLKGRLESSQIDAGIAPHQGGLAQCYKSAARKARFLGGKLVVKFVVGPDGTVKQVHLSENDLGAWGVERCILEIARGMKFAPPKGGDGEAEFTIPLEFAGTRRTEWWPEERVETHVAEKLKELDECAEQNGVVVPSNVWVTFYVANRGEIKSVGFACPERPIDDAWADCAAGIVSGWTMPDPLGKLAKAGFRFRPE